MYSGKCRGLKWWVIISTASRGASGGPLPSNEDMGSKMPNCLRTAMKRMMTTPMANSSMPWIPMMSGQGEPTQGQACTRRPGPGERWKEAWADTSNAGLGKSTTSVFNRGEPRSDRNQVLLLGDCMGLFPGTGGSMRTRPAGWTKAAL